VSDDPDLVAPSGRTSRQLDALGKYSPVSRYQYREVRSRVVAPERNLEAADVALDKDALATLDAVVRGENLSVNDDS
jgi:hypothetical protein